MGKDDLALAEYDRAVDRFPYDRSIYAGRGDAYQTMGKYALAVADFSKMIELFPDQDPGVYRAWHNLSGHGQARFCVGRQQQGH